MPKIEKIRLPSSINYQPEINRHEESFEVGIDATELKIDQLNTETGEIDDSLILRGTHMPFQTLDPSISQDVLKFYYPGGPPNRRPTIQILGSMDEDIELNGRLKANNLPLDKKEEPLQIASLLEDIVRAGKPCRLQIGYFIKYVVFVNVTFSYRTNSDINYRLKISILGDQNPITGDEEKETQNISKKIFETESEEDVRDQVVAFQDEIRNMKDEVSVLGFDFPKKRGGLLGFIDSVFDAIQDFEGIVTDGIRIADDIASEVQKTVQRLETAILTVERLRSRLYGVQSRLFEAYFRFKSTINLRQRMNVFKVSNPLKLPTAGRPDTPTPELGFEPFSIPNERQKNQATQISNAVMSYINNLQLSLKRTEDVVRILEIDKVDKTHVVTQNDTWQSLSVRYFNNIDRWQEIKELNDNKELINLETILIPK